MLHDSMYSNLVPRVFVPYCACWLDETSDEDAGYEGGMQVFNLVYHNVRVTHPISAGQAALQ